MIPVFDHYQDNRAEYFLKSGNRQHLVDDASAGVIALLFGNPEPGTTSATDSRGDGIANGGATGLTATVSDDDGGFLRSSAGACYGAGPVSLP
jgi:hypothetical protein